MKMAGLLLVQNWIKAENGEHTICIPNHKPLKIGTLNSILNDVSEHLNIEKQSLIERLLSR